MEKALVNLGKKLIKNTGYPRIIRRLINLSPLDVRIEGENITISRGCGFGGHISLGDKTKIEKNCKLYGEIKTDDRVLIREFSKLNGDINIGKGSRLQKNIDITGDVSFGKYSAAGRRSTFISRNHPTSRASLQFNFNNTIVNQEMEHTTKGPITVGNDVWIGAEVMVLSGVSIGDGAIIGGGSVVTNDVPAYSIVAGSPARQRGWRFNEKTREQLQNINWWDWSEEKIQENKSFFSKDLSKVDDVWGLIK
jgi:virginiamycin A acetyltransferase